MAMDGKEWSDSATLLKEGHMAIAKEMDWESTLPGARLTLLNGSLARTPRCRGAVQRRQQQPRGPRLYREPALPVYLRDEPGGSMISLRRYQEDTRDWRKLHPREILRYFTDLDASLQTPRNPKLYITSTRRPEEENKNFEGMMAAVAIGNLQACGEGTYWAPCFEEGSTECRNIRAPMSRAFSSPPDISKLEARHEGPPSISVSAESTPLAVCQDLASETPHPHVALVRVVPLGDARAVSVGALGDFREAQLHLRTTYLQALHDMPRHLHADPAQSLEAGALIYTTDVQVLRGPMEAGAPWLEQRPRMDIIAVGIQRHPRCDDQGQYARIAEKAHMAKIVDSIFACAAAHDVDVLVFPPLGVGGAGGCHHPAEDVGDLLRKAAFAHSHLVPRVRVCKDYRDQVHGDWAAFAAAASEGRAATEHRALVPLTASLYLRPGWGELTSSVAATLRHTKGRPTFRSLSGSGRRLPDLRCTRPSPQAASLGTAGRAIAC